MACISPVSKTSEYATRLQIGPKVPAGVFNRNTILHGALNSTSDTAFNAVYAGMLAPDGRCKTLDAAADGYVRAEAAAMMLIGVGTADGAVAVLSGRYQAA